MRLLIAGACLQLGPAWSKCLGHKRHMPIIKDGKWNSVSGGILHPAPRPGTSTTGTTNYYDYDTGTRGLRGHDQGAEEAKSKRARKVWFTQGVFGLSSCASGAMGRGPGARRLAHDEAKNE